MTDYEELIRRHREVTLLSTAANVLSWDQETNMPGGAADFRAEQLSFLEGQAHRLATEPQMGEWIATTRTAGPHLPRPSRGRTVTFLQSGGLKPPSSNCTLFLNPFYFRSHSRQGISPA